MSRRLDTLRALEHGEFMFSDEQVPMRNGFLMCLALTHGIDRFRDVYLRTFPEQSHETATAMYHNVMNHAKSIREQFVREGGS